MKPSRVQLLRFGGLHRARRARHVSPLLLQAIGPRRFYATETSEFIKAHEGVFNLHQQDAQGRIRFLPVRRGTHAVQELYPKAISYSVHVIPFWLMMYQLKPHMTYRDPTTPKGLERSENLDMGCMVPAVPKGHWARGLFLQDDIRHTLQILEMFETSFGGIHGLPHPYRCHSEKYQPAACEIVTPFATQPPFLNSNGARHIARLTAAKNVDGCAISRVLDGNGSVLQSAVRDELPDWDDDQMSISVGC